MIQWMLSFNGVLRFIMLSAAELVWGVTFADAQTYARDYIRFGARTVAIENLPIPSGMSTATTTIRDFQSTGRSGIIEYNPTIGQPASGQEYTLISNGDGTYQAVQNLLSPGYDRLRTGDFNGDGITDLIVYRTSNAAAAIRHGQR